MSIQDVSTSFYNLSAGPYVQTDFNVNNQGFAMTQSATLALPGLYGQGCTILSCSLLSPTTDLATLLGGTGAVSVIATSNNASTSGTRVLYTAIGTGSTPGTGLGQTLPADSWLQLAYTGPGSLTGTANQIGLVVQWTKLTQTQPRNI